MSWLRDHALSLGFDDLGVASATQGTPSGEIFLQSLSEGLMGPLDYLERTKDERSDVQKLMPGARSVVVVVKNYYAGDHADYVPLEALTSKAKISRYAWGRDYHHWFKKRLRKLREKVIEVGGEGTRAHIFNDTGPVLERAWAQEAGLGFIGKSGLFIHRRYGTWVFLGGLVTDLPLAPHKPVTKSLCGSCTRCIDSCPTKAILAPRKIDARRCLTTWNVERPMDSAGEAPELLGHKWAVGCDRCQEVCPWNKFEQRCDEARFQPMEGRVAIDTPPTGDLAGTPLARPKIEGITRSLVKSLYSAH